MENFEAFQKKDKFNPDEKLMYTGVQDSAIKSILNIGIQLITEDFIKLSKEKSTTEKDYQDAISTGLKRYTKIYSSLDTEDRERICYYIEELMDIVELKSSGGHLNKFVYGFDINLK